LLPDAGYLQEEEARNANRHGYSRHHPALPLFTREEGERAVRQFEAVDWHQEREIRGGLRFTLRRAGHLLGAASVLVRDAATSVLFSGDLGRPDDILMPAPEAPGEADHLVVESTYGNRRHNHADPKAALAAVVNRAVERGGVLLIPSFAVGRAQVLLHLLAQLKAERAIADVPVFLNSPMATDATRLFCRYEGEHRLTPEQCARMASAAHYVNSVDESKALNARAGPMIIVAASGMATGGRVLHHLKAFAPGERNTILFVGYQSGGTRGAAMLAGAESIKIHGEYVRVRAEVVALDQLSGHADAEELLAWLARFRSPPRRTFITHGEPAAADALRLAIAEKLGWLAEVPEYRERVTLT
jgi:metallo-beta-lactamase family protein